MRNQKIKAQKLERWLCNHAHYHSLLNFLTCDVTQSIKSSLFPRGNRLCDSYSWLLKVSKMLSFAIKRRTRSVKMMPVLIIFVYSFFFFNGVGHLAAIYFGILCFQVLSLYPAEMPVTVASWWPVYCWFLLHGIKTGFHRRMRQGSISWTVLSPQSVCLYRLLGLLLRCYRTPWNEDNLS